MTISSDSVKNEYSTDSQGTNSELPITFTYFDNSEIEVYLKADVNVDSEVKWALTTNYTITGSPGASPKVKLVTDPADGGRIIIRRKTPYTQLVDYAAGDAFPADSHETALDRVVALAQQLKEILERSLAYPNTYVNATGRSLTLPEPENNAIVKWNTDATAMVNDTDLAVSAYKIMADSAADTHPGYLDDKLLVTDSTGILKSTTGGAANQNVTISGIDATTSVKGVASFSSTQFSTSSGAVSIKSGAVIDQAKLTGALTAGSTTVKDENDMSSDSGTHLATQRSIKTYVDTQVTAVNDDATTSNKGVASFSDANFSVSSGAVSIKDGGIDNDELAGSITAAKLAGSIPDSKLSTISTADKVDIGALDIDGATEMGADIVDADKLIIDDGANGTEKSMLASRIPTYVFSKTSGDVSIGSDGTAAIGTGVIVNADVKSDAAIAQSKVALDITNSEVNASAAIAQSKLNLSITNSEVNASAAIAQSKLALDITNSEVNASAAIAQSKLNLSITNSEVNASAAIADTKLATISTANKVGIGALDIDGGTAIDALADDDLFIVDDGAGGTNKKMTAAQLKTYTGGGGGGVGSIDTIFTMQAKDESAASAASGDDAVFRGAAASVTSAPTLDTTAGKLINQTKVFKYASGSGSTNDWWLYSESIPQGYQNRNMVLQLQYYMEETSGDNLNQAFRFVARDATNGKVTQLNGAVSSSNTIVLDAFADGDFTVGDRVTFKDTGGAIHFRYITSVTHGSEQLTISGAAVSIADDSYFVSGILTDELDYLPNFKPTTAGQDGAKAYRKQLVIPSNCDTLEYGFHYLGSETDQFLYYDDIALSANQFLQTSSQGLAESYTAKSQADFFDNTGNAVLWDTSLLIPRGSSPALADSRLITIEDMASVNHGTVTGIKAKVPIVLDIQMTNSPNDSGFSAWYFNGDGSNADDNPFIAHHNETSAGGDGIWVSVAGSIKLNKNEMVYYRCNSADSRTGGCSITATPQVNDVVLLNSQDEIFSDWNDNGKFTDSVKAYGSGSGGTDPTFADAGLDVNTYKWRRDGSDMLIYIAFRNNTSTGMSKGTGGDYVIDLPSGYTADAGFYKFGPTTDVTGGNTGGIPIQYNILGKGSFTDGSAGTTSGETYSYLVTDSKFKIGVIGQYGATQNWYGNWGSTHFHLEASTVNWTLQARIKIAGWSSTFNPVLSMPLVDLGTTVQSAILKSPNSGRPSGQDYGASFSDSTTSGSGLFTLTNDTTSGCRVTINQRCRLFMTGSNYVGANDPSFGFYKNLTDAEMDVNPHSQSAAVNDDKLIMFAHGPSSTGGGEQVSGYLDAMPGDVITVLYVNNSFVSTGDAWSGNYGVTFLAEKTMSDTNLAHIIKPAVAYITDVKSESTTGGNCSTSPWATRTLNTIKGESWFIESLSSNIFTLSAGMYKFNIRAPFYRAGDLRIRLYDTTNSVGDIGASAFAQTDQGGTHHVYYEAIKTVTASTGFRVEYSAEYDSGSSCLGNATDDTGEFEIYTTVQIEKLK